MRQEIQQQEDILTRLTNNNASQVPAEIAEVKNLIQQEIKRLSAIYLNIDQILSKGQYVPNLPQQQTIGQSMA